MIFFSSTSSCFVLNSGYSYYLKKRERERMEITNKQAHRIVVAFTHINSLEQNEKKSLSNKFGLEGGGGKNMAIEKFKA